MAKVRREDVGQRGGSLSLVCVLFSLLSVGGRCGTHRGKYLQKINPKIGIFFLVLVDNWLPLLKFFNPSNPQFMETLQTLKAQLENLYNEMPRNHFEQSQRDKSAFLISREIERLENPEAYEENKSHWEGHEIRF